MSRLQNVVRRVSRAVAFGRHMPLHRLARRIELDVLRRVQQRTGPLRRASAAPPAQRAAGGLVLPLFAPRRGKLEQRGGTWHFTFNNRTCAAGDAVGTTSGLINWHVGGDGPGHQLWRMNLHYMEYLEEADDSQFVDLINQWITANPAYGRGYWRDSWNSYTVSLRTVVWMQQLTLRGDRVDAATQARASASLVEQLRFLEANLETDLGGNHLLKNIKALLLAAVYFGGDFGGPDAARWRAKGQASLTIELARQIPADGMHYERSVSYHCQIFADLLELRQALGVDPLDGQLDDALARMAQVTADLAHPDGSPALFNDAGLTMAYQPAETLAVYASLFGQVPAPRAAFGLHDAGYYGWRTGTTYLVADCGRIAPDDLPAHGHGDVLSFELSVGGQRVIVDQGVFEYTGSKRPASRAASNHNTLCLEGADQADFFGAFRCGRRPNVEVRRFDAAADGLVLAGSHDGFAHLAGAPRHVRRIEATSVKIMIHDRIEGQTDRAAMITFLLHPDARVTVSGTTAQIVRGGSTVDMTCTGLIQVTDAVWWPDMGHELPTKRLQVSLVNPATDLKTVLVLRTQQTGHDNAD